MTLAAFAKRIDIPYAGQSAGPFMHQVIDTIIRRKQRRYLSDTEKRQLLESQQGQCKLCQDTIWTEAEYDHCIPLHQMTSDQSLDCFQAICAQCHTDKTKSETRPTLGVLESNFNSNTHNAYKRTTVPPCMNYKSGEDFKAPYDGNEVKSLLAVDIIRSRYSALYEAPYLPVFSVLDDVKPVKAGSTLPDLVYIDTGQEITSDVQSKLAALPYYGASLYCKPAVEYLLHRRRRTWADMK